jgi:hypothetical protein
MPACWNCPNHFPFLGDDSDKVTNEVAEFITGAKPPVGDERILARPSFSPTSSIRQNGRKQLATDAGVRFSTLTTGHFAVN